MHQILNLLLHYLSNPRDSKKIVVEAMIISILIHEICYVSQLDHAHNHSNIMASRKSCHRLCVSSLSIVASGHKNATPA
jgi:hypothetical protein